MRKALFGISFLLAFAALLFIEAGCGPVPEAGSQLDPEALFAFEIQPMLETKCLACHGREPEELEADYDLRSRATALAGGASGKAAIVPGKPERSTFVHAVRRTDPDFAMPPKAIERLTEQEIAYVEQWIAAGAPWPDSARQEALMATMDWSQAERLPVATEEGQSEAWNNRRYARDNLWAYLPVEEPQVPWSTLDEEQGNPIDAFLMRRIREEGLRPAPPADKRTLIRRATFDLTGLPPSPKEVTAFLADESPDAFARVVDRLLASPHYGERWAQHWLDLVRYADSDGYSNDFLRPNAWRYRDYVIRSFNSDKPYDQFIVEQIAGDELDPDDPEMLVAAGFLRMGPWEHTAMSVAAETRQLFLDDVTNSVGEVFLSTPLSCAKCHDHKYDPIPTKDYYQVQAVFATTQFADRPAPFLKAENTRLTDTQKARIEAWIEKTAAEQTALREKEEDAARAWYRERGQRYLPKWERRKLPEDQQPPRYLGLTNEDLGYRKVLNKRLQLLRHNIQRFEPLAYSVYNGPDREVRSGRRHRLPEDLEGAPAPTHILGGGSVYSPQDVVQPGVLSVVAKLRQPMDGSGAGRYEEPRLPTGLSGRRLAFARWLADPQNPLTTRSVVNRIWQYHFGKGIAANSNNFGATGAAPTHPELLDWLARQFVQQGWSFKAMHRLIMLSEAYQRSAQPIDAARQTRIDPDNDLLAHFSPRRLTAEEIRDAMLTLSGELNPEMGGLPVRPEINREVALQPRHIMGSISPAYQASRTPAERNRRSIYAERYRGLADPFMQVLDRPGTELSCERRDQSTVAPQAFTLFNSERSRNRALALGHRLAKEASNPEARVERAIELVWNRPATPAEREKCLAYLEEMEAYHQKNSPVPHPQPTEVTRHMFEEMTGEAFSYVEELDIYQDYTPDLKPTDVAPETRALGDLALVLFNTNEFLYVY